MRRKLFLGSALGTVVLLLTAAGLYVLMNSRTYQVAGRIVPRVDTDQPVVALTLNDGPAEHAASLAAIPLIAAGLKGRGYTFVTISDLLAKSGSTWTDKIVSLADMGSANTCAVVRLNTYTVWDVNQNVER
ncbi:hypothetical protein AB0L82_10040 [Nocardia sp. NPDC052001]|uniref:hypothetical protein n=1 Tax=Nocardia sp. NPDC052001 TaxID=3154853 RepID=UPI00342B5AE7